MKSYLAYLALALAMLACSTADMVQTVTPPSTVVVVSPLATLESSATAFLSTPVDFGTLVLDDERTVCADALNVRSGPGLESSAVAWLRRGDTVRVLESRDGWVRLANPVGWVRGVYLCDG